MDVCALIDAPTASRLAGEPYTTATTETGGFGSQCTYDDENSTGIAVNVGVDDENADTTWEEVHTGDVTDIGGLGDKALWDNDNTLYVLTGSRIIQINGLDDQAPAEAMARALLAALG